MAAITRRALLSMLGLATVATAAGTTLAQAVSPARERGLLRLRGVVRYAANGPLPVGVLTIRLEEQGVMDKAARQIASARVRSDGRRRTVPFEMNVPRAALARAADPGFTVRLERNGRLTAINTSKQRYRGGRTATLTIEPILY
ncbi:YbaY family lipoprotein [Mesorhizobium sp. SP-1A]|uniref:YbaY family lipoprotein n=1 Tax=Mesorhizobium sp. SP-1A TaxID=3077840 RepID=UPI0028F6DA46|nr:YbaY family lipoprotein [Mesorhizobium sp. SP-1A]